MKIIKYLKAIVIAMVSIIVFSVNTAFAEIDNVRGKTMAQIKAIYGEPIAVKGPVGGFSATRPPITEWQYDNFFITFENNIVLHGNAKGSLAMELNQ